MNAEKNNGNVYTVIFRDKQHKDFYRDYLPRCSHQDERHRALVYCLGLNAETRAGARELYNFEAGKIMPEFPDKEWQNGECEKIVRMALALYCGGVSDLYGHEEWDGRLDEYISCPAGDLFCCEAAAYLWEAVKLRYPEYAGKPATGIEVSYPKTSGRKRQGNPSGSVLLRDASAGGTGQGRAGGYHV